MKNNNLSLKILAVSLLLTSLCINSSKAASLSNRLDNMGGNKELMKKAKAVDSQNRFRIVQKRAVDRDLRLEFGVSYGFNAGGDSYINTQNLGASVDFHINPKWSFGARYLRHNNELTNEGKRINDQFEATPGSSTTQAVDYPLSSTLGVISFYPLYGKINWFDVATTQFDFYLLAGAGQMELKSGSSPTWTTGGGIGMWISQNFSSRLEVRYQSYEDEIYSGTRQQGLVVSTLSVGFLL